MKRPNIQFITRTGMLLAVTIVIQMLGRLLPPSITNFVVGPLINACLLIATAIAGIGSGLVIAIAAPFTSLILNHAPIAAALLPFAPVIALSNAVYVVAFYIFRNKSTIAGITIGSILKFGILYGGIILFFQLIDAIGWTALSTFKTPLTLLFSYPQLITSLIGGIVGLVAIKLLDRQFKMR